MSKPQPAQSELDHYLGTGTAFPAEQVSAISFYSLWVCKEGSLSLNTQHHLQPLSTVLMVPGPLLSSCSFLPK